MTFVSYKLVLLIASLSGKLPWYNAKTSQFQKFTLLSSLIAFLVVFSSILTFHYGNYMYERHFLNNITTIVRTIVNLSSALGSAYWYLEDTKILQDSLILVNLNLVKLGIVPQERKYVTVTFVLLNVLYFILLSPFVIYFATNKLVLAFCIVGTLQAALIFVGILVEIILLDFILERLRCLKVAVNRVSTIDERELEVQVGALVNVYDKLCDSVDSFNNVFGWQIFLQLLFTLTGGLTLFDFVLADGDKQFFTVYSVCFTFLPFLGTLSVLALHCQWIVNECGIIKVLVCKGLIRDSSNEMKKIEWNLLQQQLNMRPLSISAAGFFDVNYAIAFVFANMMVGYMIVIIQLTRIC